MEKHSKHITLVLLTAGSLLLPVAGCHRQQDLSAKSGGGGMYYHDNGSGWGNQGGYGGSSYGGFGGGGFGGGGFGGGGGGGG